MDICRFSGQNDMEYRKVVAALNRVLEATVKLAPIGVSSVLNADKRRSFLDSLRFDQIDTRHATIKAAHAKTCRWLLSKSEYQDWRDVNKISEHHGFLWIKGKPGTGKSTIMKFAYANAKKTMTDTIIISFFFNARGERLEKSAEGMYRSLLFQLLEKLPELQIVFDSLESTAPNGGDSHRWDIEKVKNLFGSAIEKIGRSRLTCFIDALDECEEDQVREMVAFFESLGHLAVLSQIRFCVCFSSRHYPHISIDKSVQLILEGQEGHQQDMANYLHSELKAGRSKGNELIEQIKAEILERASGIFLWVVLVVQMLNKEYDRGRIHALRKRLDEIPNGLDELFRDILTRDGDNMEELILCLQWILYAKRPLKREELYFAILAGVEPNAVTAWNAEEITNEIMERFVLSASKGFAEVTKSKDQTVQFIHESVRDFLLKGNGLNALRSDLASNFPGQGHERLKQCCQNCMRINLSEHVPLTTPLPTASSEDAANLRRLVSGKFPFLEYAVEHVLYHADAAVSYGVSQDNFIQNFPLREWITLDSLLERYQIRRHSSDASLLYILAEENLPNLIQVELKRVPHMDIKGERYGFPLLAALAKANGNAVRALLMPYDDARSDNDILQDYPPCSTARELEEAIDYLLKNGRDISLRKKLTGEHRTLLLWAVESGASALVKVLLETKKVDMDSGARGRLLLWAASGGHEAVVRLLVARSEVDVNSKDNYERTPLSWAAERGHEAVVKLLVARSDVDVNSKDNCRRTPLSWAALGGHEAVVKLLVARSDVDVNSNGLSGWTPLRLAAERGRETVVKLLVARSDVDVNSKDLSGWTPLQWAAERGHEAVVKLLVARSDIDVNSKDDYERTPLSWAASGGHEAVIKLLVTRSDVDVNSKDYYGRTPLWSAAEGGHEAVVKLLQLHGALS
jgi:ankyrin repeat protein